MYSLCFTSLILAACLGVGLDCAEYPTDSGQVSINVANLIPRGRQISMALQDVEH